MDKQILLSTAYFPPISYLKAIIGADTVDIETAENFVKKTYRNRCKIAAANGIINLTIPVEEAVRRKVLIRDVKIDNSVMWQKQHIKSIESAYNSSPFYEYLIDDFMPFYLDRYNYLLDFNTRILQKILELIEVEANLNFTEQYNSTPENRIDLRSLIQPKMESENPYKMETPYKQVFIDKYGFRTDLSCLDLIFNLGSEAYSYISGNYVA